MNRRISQGLVFVALAAMLLVVSATVMQASANQISGVGVQVPDCGGQSSDFTIAMSGSLVGCWYTVILDSRSTPSGAYHESGTEIFVGCLQDVGCGTFNTTYKFNGKFTPDFVEIHGRCEHRIVSGTGVFSGGGRIDIKDDVVNGILNYRGHIFLP